jgi:hypothetical protein
MQESFNPYTEFKDGIEQPIPDYTQKWLEIYKKALILKPESFQLFVFGVGLSGTDEERCYKAETILEMLQPISSPYTLYCQMGLKE